MSVAVVTGATGFIGSHLVSRLLRGGWTVNILKRTGSDTSFLESVKTERGELVQHDIETESPNSIWDSVGRADVVYHLATAYGRDGDDESVRKTNVEFPSQLLKQAHQKAVGLFVAADTCFPVSYPYLQSYTRSKKEFASVGRDWALSAGRRFVNLVLQHPYGPKDGDGKFVPWIMKQCLANVEAIDLTSGEQQKDFIFVDDVVEAMLLLSEKRNMLPIGFSEIECGRGNSISIKDFVKQIHKVSKSSSLLNFGAIPNRKGEIEISKADISQLRKLGWEPKTTTSVGIHKTLESLMGEASQSCQEQV